MEKVEHTRRRRRKRHVPYHQPHLHRPPAQVVVLTKVNRCARRPANLTSLPGHLGHPHHWFAIPESATSVARDLSSGGWASTRAHH